MPDPRKSETLPVGKRAAHFPAPVRESERLLKKMGELQARHIELCGAVFDAIETLRRHKIFSTARANHSVLDSLPQKEFTEQLATGPDGSLTRRQQEIVRLVAEGKTNKEMAEMLHLSVKTIETHRANIMKKLECRSMSDLILYAVRMKIIQV